MEEQIIPAKALVLGETYVTVERNPGYLFTHEKGSAHGYVPYVFISDRVNVASFYTTGCIDGNRNNSFSSYRLANEEEREWFRLCIEANKLVDRPKVEPKVVTPIINDHYSIY